MADLSVIYRIAADITGLQDGVNRAANAAEGLGTTAKRVGGVLSAAFTGLQIKQAASEVVQFSSHLTDMAAKSGITAEAVQELDFVAKQSGSSFDQVSQALALMGDRLVGGDKSTVGALEKLGLNLTDLQAMAPDAAFEAIAEAITHIEDPMIRSNVAMDLFGKAGASLLPVLTSDVGGLRDKARELGLVMSNEVVEAGDNLDDKFAELEQRVKTVKGNALTPLLNYFLHMPGWMQTGAAAVSEFGGALTGIGTSIMLAGGPVAILGTLKTALMGLAGLLTLPAGLVVAAIVGLVAIWYKWDEIKVIVQNVYTAVKTWLVDKFQAIVDSIKGKIDAVTGFFKGMYDKVAGNSYVPDMVARIASAFGKLQGVMVTPAAGAASAVQGIFSTMLGNMGGMLGQFTQAAAKWLDGLIGGLSAKWSSAVSGILSGVGAMAKGGSVLQGVGAAANAGMAAGMTAAMSGATIGGSVALGAATMGVGLAAVGIYKGITSWMGQREHMAVNDMRDDWFNEHGDLAGVNQAAQGAGDTDLSTTRAIFAAKTKDQFAAAVKQWENVTGLAAGGLVRQPTLAMVGERGPELVTPLDKLGSLGLGQPIVVHLSIDGRRFMEATAKYLPRTVEQWVGA